MRIRLEDADGNKFAWSVKREIRKPASWVLKDHNGYERVLESVWAASVPRIKLIAENHGLSLAQELS